MLGMSFFEKYRPVRNEMEVNNLNGSPRSRALHHDGPRFGEVELRRFLHQIRCWLRVVFVIANNLYCIPTYLVWMWVILYPLRVSIPALYWAIERRFYKLLLLMPAFWSFSGGYVVEEVGEDVSECYKERCLVMANHQSTADVPLLMTSFQLKSTVTEHVMWIMDKLFKYTNFGAVSYIHGDFFIAQGKDVRDQQIRRLREHIAATYLERNLRWIVVFPEGGFLRKRIQTSQKYARKYGYPLLEYVTLPRVGAMEVCMDMLSPQHLLDQERLGEDGIGGGDVIVKNGIASKHSSSSVITSRPEKPLKWIIDITIGYPDQKPLDLLTILSGSRKPCTVQVHYRRYPIEEVPHETEKFTKWLYDRWVEKESLLKEFYATGSFPAQSAVEREAGVRPNAPLRSEPLRDELNIPWVVAAHALFIASSLFHLALWRWFSSLIWWS